MANIYLSLDKAEFEKQSKRALDLGAEDLDESLGKIYLFKDQIKELECSFDSGEILITGQFSGDMGYLSINFEPDLDTIAAIIGHYVKKMNKLKTVLEAVD